MPHINRSIKLRAKSNVISWASNITGSSGSSLMYSGKSVGPSIEPYGAPPLSGYSCIDFPSSYHSNDSKSSITEKWRSKTKYPNWGSIELDIVNKTLPKALILSSTSWVGPDLLKCLKILSNTTVRRSAIEGKDPKPYWKLERRLYLSRWSTIFLKILLTTKRTLTHFMSLVSFDTRENIRKPVVFCFQGYRKRPVAWNGLIQLQTDHMWCFVRFGTIYTI